MTNAVYKLCYIDRQLDLFFTTAPLKEQWGDDWDDAPYEHNAGTPYRWCKDHCGKRPPKRPWSISIKHITRYCRISWRTPADLYQPNSPYSVEDINHKKVPWLQSERGLKIWAGMSPEQVEDLLMLERL